MNLLRAAFQRMIMTSCLSSSPNVVTRMWFPSKLDLAFSLRGIRYFPVDRSTFLGLKVTN